MRAALPRRGDYVWLAHTYGARLVYHTNAERDDRPWTDGEHEGLVAGWAFTVCGITVYPPKWEPGWSDRQHRFYAGDPRGTQLPLRLLNPERVRPCRRCFTVDDDT